MGTACIPKNKTLSFDCHFCPSVSLHRLPHRVLSTPTCSVEVSMPLDFFPRHSFPRHFSLCSHALAASSSFYHNVPYCSGSDDIGDKTYHLTQTDLSSVKASWAPNYVYDLTPHRHYRLILDDIGQPLDKFKCSHDMVRAVHATLVGKFFFGRVKVYLSDSCTVTHGKYLHVRSYLLVSKNT
jgi:hypothetical protein